MAVPVCRRRSSPRGAVGRLNDDVDGAQDSRLFRNELNRSAEHDRRSRRPRQQGPQPDEIVRRRGAQLRNPPMVFIQPKTCSIISRCRSSASHFFSTLLEREILDTGFLSVVVVDADAGRLNLVRRRRGDVLGIANDHARSHRTMRLPCPDGVTSRKPALRNVAGDPM